MTRTDKTRSQRDRRSHPATPVSLYFWLVYLLTPVLVAQVDRTAITGTVIDQQANRVPQCRVRATDDATSVLRRASASTLPR